MIELGERTADQMLRCAVTAKGLCYVVNHLKCHDHSHQSKANNPDDRRGGARDTSGYAHHSKVGCLHEEDLRADENKDANDERPSSRIVLLRESCNREGS